MNIEIANRLVELRKKNGLSQEELAEKLGLSRQAVSKWERAEASPDTDNLICLAKLYGVSLDELLRTDQPLDDIVHEMKEKEEQKVDEQEAEEAEGEVVDEDEQVEDEDDIDEDIPHRRPLSKSEKRSLIATSLLFPIALVAYIIVGNLWTNDNMGWKWGWTLLLDAIWISSIVPVIMHKRLTEFAYPIFVVALYCTLGFFGTHFGFNGWGVYWFLFITIPIYYVIAVRIQAFWTR